MSIDFFGILVSLFLTATVYTLPIMIYRYCIKKEPINKRKAKIITVICAIIGFIILSVIKMILANEVATGGGLLLWSFVNYKILTYEKFSSESTKEEIMNRCEELRGKQIELTKYLDNCVNSKAIDKATADELLEIYSNP